MSCETDGTPKETQKPQKPQWAINRDAANMLGIDWDAPREDQKGYGHDFSSGRGLPANWQDCAKLICTIVYNPTDRTIKYIRPDGKEYPGEIEEPEPQPEK